jgi:hypothetical protein
VVRADFPSLSPRRLGAQEDYYLCQFWVSDQGLFPDRPLVQADFSSLFPGRPLVLAGCCLGLCGVLLSFPVLPASGYSNLLFYLVAIPFGRRQFLFCPVASVEYFPDGWILASL